MISYLKGPYNSEGRILINKKKTREKGTTTTKIFLVVRSKYY